MNGVKIALFLSVCFSTLNGCSYVQGFFPDKHKDYQFTQEIAPLVIPPDLNGQRLLKSSEKGVDDLLRQARNVNTTMSSIDKKAIAVVFVEYPGSAPRIRIADNIQRSWHWVGKVLSRHSIEIMNRNQMESMYLVQYDADFEKVEDGSLWDEILFIFGSDPAGEKEFRVQLMENADFTEIIVLDKRGQASFKGDGIRLLNLLYDGIKQDLAN